MIDLTTLSGDDTSGRVRRLCAKARQPVRADLLAALGMAASSTLVMLNATRLLSFASGERREA